MASSRDVGGPRLVGRVVDPLALDGADEPKVELTEDDSLGSDESPSPPPPPPPAPGDVQGGNAVAGPNEGRPSGHPVRERLLAKARVAESLRGLASEPDHEDSGHWAGPLEELDRIAPHRPPSAPQRARRDRLPANLTALFGVLFGLATFAAVFAVLVHVDPRDGELPPAPSASAEKAPSESGEPAAAAVEAEEPEEADPPTRAKRRRARTKGPWRIADAKGTGDRIVEGTIGREPFLRAVQDAGVPKKEAYRVLIAFKGVRDFDKCGSRDQFIALLDRASRRLKAFEYVVTKEEVYQARTRDDGLLRGEQLNLEIERSRVQGAIVMRSDSFSEAAEGGGFEPGLGAAIDEALDGHASVDQFEKGDRIRIVAQEVTVLGEFSRYAGLEALEYLPRGKDQPLRVYHFKGSKSRGYYDAAGRAPFEGGWRKPIKGAPVTSKFNPKRMHPVLKKVMPHNGTDFGAPMGTPVGASSPGTVSFLGYSGASGNLVSIQHAGGYETGYAHLSRFESGLKVGDRVDRMQVVGYVGSTGRSTGPHLHFSAKKDGKFIDAESLQLDALRVLPKGERAEFSLQRAKFDKLLEAIPLPAPLESAEPREAESAPTADDEPSSADDEAPDTEAASAEEPDDDEVEERSARPGPAPKVPEDGPAATSEAAKPRKAAASGSLYLTDRELMKAQAGSDDGEVEE